MGMVGPQPPSTGAVCFSCSGNARPIRQQKQASLVHLSETRYSHLWGKQSGENKMLLCWVFFLVGLFVFLHIREFQCCEDPVFWKSPAFSNLFCCLLQCYKEIHTCQSSYHWIRALETHNSVAVNSFYTMGSSNEKRSLSTQCLEVRRMLYKAKVVKTFVQAF